MALHFTRDEFEARMDRLQAEMKEHRLDAMLLFSQESMYWLTGYDTFGFVFFQCLIVTKARRMALLTRSADLRQARQTSIIEEIIVWTDRAGADPAKALKDHLFEMDLLGCRLGIETDTHGLTAKNGKRVEEQLENFGTLVEASPIIPELRSVKSPAEIECVRKAGRLADDALKAGLALTKPGADEGAILAAMQGAVFAGGGDYPANEFVIGSGDKALLVRYAAGRRRLDANDQLTLEFAGTYRHYHVAMMETVVLGEPRPRHREMYDAAEAALTEVRRTMRPGNTFGDVFDAHARVLHERGMGSLRLNACGYSLGAAFTPSWMQWPMFYPANPAEIVPNMVLFAHMILLDSESGTAMNLGRTFLTTDGEPEPLSALEPRFLTR
ncbi:Xaa-Pro peptidase family protein [Acuticoccus sp. I52.16.1]|uniref:M24 family metallopeptidase n=1 Tax=Acuticoccus sp. I52.16.1 TaxID=2928472 RepID=UPI001FCF8DD7|nr:Xaa-Pro peptidase family protein [Acuticoccus sp. I52.16.1]UOM33855.1 Xaa-Pro peptidase family protein [Acuticoccus sp. I52.16.1]